MSATALSASAAYSQVAGSLRGVLDRIANAASRCGRRPEDVTLVAVSKTHPVKAVEAALDAAAPVVGAILALHFLPSPKWLAVCLALASGFFLYTATSDLLPEAHRRSPSPAVMLVTILGVVIMAVVVSLAKVI